MGKVSFYADLDNVTNKRGSDELIIKLITQEISDDHAGLIMQMRNKYLNVLLSTNEITDKEAEEAIDEFKITPILDGKTASQRLRNVLYVKWNNRYKQRYPEFEKFYQYSMDLIIEAEKDSI
jgi:hypothetical protein